MASVEVNNGLDGRAQRRKAVALRKEKASVARPIYMPRVQGAGTADDEIEDEGMEDELILRGVLQCIAIGSFFTIRYLLDVLFTPRAVNTVSRQMVALLHCIIRAAWYAPVASMLLLYFWGPLQVSTVASWVLRASILRAILSALMDNTVVISGWNKRHVWVPLACWATFTRVSSRREAPQGAWRGGVRWFLCRTAPWAIRLVLFTVLSSSWPHRGAALLGSATHAWSIWPRRAEPQSDWHSVPLDHRETPPQTLKTCTSFRGYAVDCEELRRVREFNTQVMPRMLGVGYRGIRKALNDCGGHGHIWHVGHACPDPSKKSTRNEEDFGWNLFAQHALDNMELGHCLVSCNEAEYLGARHVRCTRSARCIPTCEGM